MSKADVQGLFDGEKAASAIDTNVCTIEEAPDQVIAKRFGAFEPFLANLFKSGVEARGVERVPEHQRESKYFWNSLFMWWSINVVIMGISVGTLGQSVYSLALPHTIAILICFSALGSAATAFIATLGPRTGLRTMIISRYSSGYVGGFFYSLLNIFLGFGFCATSVIIGGQTLASINPDALSLVGGIIIISVCSLVPCFVGYNMVHAYERYAWIVMFFIMCCLYGLGGNAGFDVNAQKALENTGRTLTADIVSFGSVAFGGTCFVTISADYTVYLPVDVSFWRVFILTFLGVFLPSVFVTTLGAALITITDPTYVAAFGPTGNTGALIAQVLSPWEGGGKFLLVLLALSTVALNVVGTYSVALSIQALGRPFAMIPRFLWVLFIAVGYTVAGAAGREHFIVILSNLLSISAYWTVIFFVIVAEEHILFRREGGRLGGYNLADWDNPSKLPMGIGGLSACMFGIVGAVLGMSQVYYTGPIAKVAGGAAHADVGFELAAGFTALTFPPLRWLEIHFMGR